MTSPTIMGELQGKPNTKSLIFLMAIVIYFFIRNLWLFIGFIIIFAFIEELYKDGYSVKTVGEWFKYKLNMKPTTKNKVKMRLKKNKNK